MGDDRGQPARHFFANLVHDSAGNLTLAPWARPLPQTGPIDARPACPNCGAALVEQRCKLVCERCKVVVESCSDGGRMEPTKGA